MLAGRNRQRLIDVIGRQSGRPVGNGPAVVRGGIRPLHVDVPRITADARRAGVRGRNLERGTTNVGVSWQRTRMEACKRDRPSGSAIPLAYLSFENRCLGREGG